MPLKNLISLSSLTLLVALALSAVAAWYSIIGLTAIFAGAVIPVIIMGSILEIGKITTTVWLRKYWHQCSWVLKLYLVPAVIALAILTSMGIFGFLSKAHMDSGIISGDVQAKLALYDEKIKTQRDNIEIARKALTQMDAQVDARLSRGDSEQGAERAVQIRRQQQAERAKLQKEIGDAQKEIAKLNEERAPIAAENRKVEAEVGPIKYVAALIYGDNPDSNLLERAVRWVTILLVVVFDPLAIALVLAANSSKEWDKKISEDKALMNLDPEPDNVNFRPFTQEEIKAMETPWPSDWKEAPSTEEVNKFVEQNAIETLQEIEKEEIDHSKHSYLDKGFGNTHPPGIDPVKPLVNKEEVSTKPNTNILLKELDKKSEDEIDNSIEKKLSIVHKLHDSPTDKNTEPTVDSTEIITEGVTKEFPYEDLADGWVKYDRKVMQKSILQRIKPELFAEPDVINTNKTDFGTSFPKISNRGDIFVRVDSLPNRVFKFDGSKWIEVNKDLSGAYLDNSEYVQFLINKIYTGEYDLETLTIDERNQIEFFLKNQTS